MKVFMSLVVALVAAATLSPATATVGTQGIAPRRRFPEPFTVIEGVAHHARRLDELEPVPADNEATDLVPEVPETSAEEGEVAETGDEAESPEATTEAPPAPAADADAPVEEEVAPLIEPVSFTIKVPSSSGSSSGPSDSDADTGNEAEDVPPQADDRRRNLRSL